jgi:hypothetical protein
LRTDNPNRIKTVSNLGVLLGEILAFKPQCDLEAFIKRRKSMTFTSTGKTA